MKKLVKKASFELDELGKIILGVILLIVLLLILAYISGALDGQKAKIREVFSFLY